jgi:pyrroline-5-carboxylate reductase
MTISIIGSGNMGTALVKAFLQQNLLKPKDIVVTDQSEEKLKHLQKLGVSTSTNNQKILKSDIILFAVKPQSFSELAKELTKKIPKKTIIISIMAGVGITKMKKHLGHQRIIRSMPNTPAMVGEGVTGWYADKSITGAEKKKVQALFESTGMAIEVKKETLLNDFTCLSGSGPGFFFYVFEQWLKATKELNLPSDQTAKILAKTIQGSLKLLELSGEKPEQLRSNVTSKGGTTEAGLEILQKAKLENLFAKTLKAAYNRCKNLG